MGERVHVFEWIQYKESILSSSHRLSNSVGHSIRASSDVLRAALPSLPHLAYQKDYATDCYDAYECYRAVNECDRHRFRPAEAQQQH